MAQPSVDENQNEMGKQQTELLEQLVKAQHQIIELLGCIGAGTYGIVLNASLAGGFVALSAEAKAA